jgi:hypothetical protein
VNYTLPSEATNLRFQSGTPDGRFILTEEGFADTMGVPPGTGQYQVMFVYDMPYNRKMELVQELTLPVQSVIVLVPESGMRIRSDQLQDNGSRDIQGVNYRLFAVDTLNAGDQLAFTLSGNGQGNASAASLIDIDGSDTTLIGLFVLGGAVVVAGVWYYRRRKTIKGDGMDGISEADAYDDPDSVMDAIIALDDLYQADELPEGAYRERRAELKTRLQDLLMDQEEA